MAESPAVHHMSGLTYTRQDGTCVSMSPGYPACVSGRAAERIARSLFRRGPVTCRRCLKLLALAAK